jgi:hypothetical protein
MRIAECIGLWIATSFGLAMLVGKRLKRLTTGKRHPDDPAWPEGSATWYQVYQTVSEGSPVTPPFATKEELIEYLVKFGDEWDQSRTAEGRQASAGWPRKAAEQFVKSEWAPSMMVVNGGPQSGIYTAATGFPADREEKP